MSLNGIDISSWQAGIDLSVVPCDFAIIKATGGTGYVNPDCDRAFWNAVNAGKKVGVYHYAREVGYEGSATAEADFFVDNCKGYAGKAVFVLDWEQDTGLGVGWAKTFLDRVRERIGVKPMIYMSNSIVNGYDWSPVVNADYGLWNAGYYAYGTTFWGYNPEAPLIGGTGAWGGAAIYQYTSEGRLNGWGGNLDLNVFYGDGAAWDAYAGAEVDPDWKPSPTPGGGGSDDLEALADAVIRGDYGNGQDRINALGDKYDAVMAIVNARLGGGGGSTGGGSTYTVVSGDTLSGIGAKLGVDWTSIASANGIGSPYTIYPGQVLTIPGGSGGSGGGGGATYTVQSGDTLSGIGAKYGVNYQAIASANGISDPNVIYPGQVLVIPGASGGSTGGGGTYTVQSGDTLSGIAAANGWGGDYMGLASKNGISDPNKIYPGQVIYL